ncbi:MAG TPA: hypothetical protein VF364_04690 [Candidatus Limnocylindria bacterium]
MEASRNAVDRALLRLEEIHPDPFHAVSRAEFVAAAEELKARLADLAPEAAAVELMRLWARLSVERDGHQFALPTPDAAETILPFRVYEFSDGVFITDAMPPHQELIGSRITAIGDEPIADLLASLEPLVPRDSPATVPSFRPIFLLRSTVLRGLGVIGAGAVPITVEQSGAAETILLEPVSRAEFEDWGGSMAYGLMPYHGLTARDGLRHAQPSGDQFQIETMPDSGAVYVRYGRVLPIGRDEIDELEALAARPEVDRIIVDLRQNTGGDNGSYGTLLALLRNPAIDRPGRLYVLIDRVTFSAAANLAAEIEGSTAAIFVGEPMGGGLNFWNDTVPVGLADFPIPMELAVSTRYWQKSTADDPRLTITPELSVPVTAADYFAGIDRALEVAINDHRP